MKSLFLSLFLLAASFALSACTESHGEDAHAHENHQHSAATYKDGHGVQLTPEARRFLQLEISEVTLSATATAPAALTVPREAVVRTVRGDFVYVVNGEWYLRTPVQVGPEDVSTYSIHDGLLEGDQVVSRGVSALVLAEIQAVNGGVGCADGH